MSVYLWGKERDWYQELYVSRILLPGFRWCLLAIRVNLAASTTRGCFKNFNSVLDEAILYTEKRFTTMGEFIFFDLLNPKLFLRFRKKIPVEVFSSLNVYKKNILGLDGWKCRLKSDWNSAAVFCKASVKYPRSRRHNARTWTKPNSDRSNQIITFDLAVSATSASWDRSFLR